jgi:hypothetical protein
MQALLDRSPQAYFYFSDQFATYNTLVYYPALHQALPNKSQTYSVEADNAELRHYLARLVRKSRCFSRCIYALWVSTPSGALLNSLSLLGTVVNFINRLFPTILLLSMNLYLLELRHSPI